MTLKANFILVVLTGCLSVIILTSCGSHIQKVDDAFDRVKKERMMSNDSSFVSKEIIQASMKTEPVKKNEIQDEWTRFKIEIEKKIRLNENKIKEIRGLADVNARLLKKVISLEKDNNDLRIKMDQYNEEVKTKWELFKVSMNHEANDIGIELNAMKIKNKK